MDRRGFFRQLSGKKQAMYPPGARPEILFSEICNGCADCVSACPQDVIFLAKNNLPVLSFDLAGCTFCGKCVDACKLGALVAGNDLRENWQWRAEISSSCLDRRGIVCRACEAACEPEAIRFSPALGGVSNVLVNLEECDGCGACIRFCPAGAISMKIPTTESLSLTKEAVA